MRFIIRIRMTVLLLMLLCLVATAAQGKQIFIENITGTDVYLLNLARPYVSAWIGGTGHSQARQMDSADYRVTLHIDSASATKSFNSWFIALFWLWPFVPFNSLDAEVVLTMNVTDASGSQVLVRTVGGKASRGVFADFLSRNWAKREAFEDAFGQLMISARLP